MSQFFLGVLNPEGHPNHMTDSKVTAILVNKWILPVGGVVSGRVCVHRAACEAGLFSGLHKHTDSQQTWGKKLTP